MENSSSGLWEFKKNLIEAVNRVATWLATQLATYMISPIAGTALSVIFISAFSLSKIKKAIDIKNIKNFNEHVKTKIIELELEFKKISDRISTLKAVYEQERDEFKRISIEEELKTETKAMINLFNIKLYYESIIRAMRAIEPYRHQYGDKVDEIIFENS